MKITVEFANLEEMYGFLADMNRKSAEPPAPETRPAAPEIVPAAPVTPVAPAAAAPAATAPAAPAQQKKVTLKDVTSKAIPLIDAGRQGDLQALLSKYGVPALPSLPEEKLADFLHDLEVLG